MRKYSRRKNLISVKWVCIAAAAAAVLETVFYLVDLLYLSVVFLGIFAVFAVFLLSMFFVSEEKYACLSSAIGIYFLGIRLKKIKFSDIKSITISNASFNTGDLGAPILSCRKNTETGEKFVIYKALEDTMKTYARPLKDFMSEVDKAKYPRAEQTYRFEKVK